VESEQRVVDSGEGAEVVGVNVTGAGEGAEEVGAFVGDGIGARVVTSSSLSQVPHARGQLSNPSVPSSPT